MLLGPCDSDAPAYLPQYDTGTRDLVSVSSMRHMRIKITETMNGIVKMSANVITGRNISISFWGMARLLVLAIIDCAAAYGFRRRLCGHKVTILIALYRLMTTRSIVILRIYKDVKYECVRLPVPGWRVTLMDTIF